MILGAIIGDMIGVPYEFRQNRHKSKDFPLFNGSNRPSDDSVLTIANMSWLLGTDLKEAMLKWCRKYPKAGYGGMFRRWLMDDDRHPYNSLGNGSAMRVSPVAWVANSLDECLDLAKQSAEFDAKMAHGKAILEEQSRAPKCPTCQSTNIRKMGGIERGASIYAFGLFSKKINKTFKCQNCGYTW